MAKTQAKKHGVSEFLRSQVDVVAARISDFQKDADRLASELSRRGHAQIQELEQLVQRFEKGPWSDRSADLAGKAKELGGELASHFEELQGKVVNFVGVATRDQVSQLAAELKQLSKRIDSFTKGASGAKGVVAAKLARSRPKR